jgi:hypothetical protein
VVSQRTHFFGRSRHAPHATTCAARSRSCQRWRWPGAKEGCGLLRRAAPATAAGSLASGATAAGPLGRSATDATCVVGACAPPRCCCCAVPPRVCRARAVSQHLPPQLASHVPLRACGPGGRRARVSGAKRRRFVTCVQARARRRACAQAIGQRALAGAGQCQVRSRRPAGRVGCASPTDGGLRRRGSVAAQRTPQRTAARRNVPQGLGRRGCDRARHTCDATKDGGRCWAARRRLRVARSCGPAARRRRRSVPRAAARPPRPHVPRSPAASPPWALQPGAHARVPVPARRRSAGRGAANGCRAPYRAASRVRAAPRAGARSATAPPVPARLPAAV